jgi:Tlde1 domain
MAWVYHQRTGRLESNGRQVATGYSGTGAGRNNPAMETLHNQGPIPRGTYTIGQAHDTRDHGPHVMSLTPRAGQNMHGRAGFLIHGDNVRHDASTGCIILPREIRNVISGSTDRELQVVP